MRQAKLCLLIKDGKILLAMKKRGFGVGKWNGCGGKLKDNERLEDAAIRELQEESLIQKKIRILLMQLSEKPRKKLE